MEDKPIFPVVKSVDESHSVSVLTENLALTGVLLFYVIAVVLCVVGAFIKQFSRSAIKPPPLPVGKVQVSFYRPIDFILVAVISGFFLFSSVGMLLVETSELTITTGTLVFNIVLQVIFCVICIALLWVRAKPATWLGLRWRQWPWIFVIAPVSVFSMMLLFSLLQSLGYFELLKQFGAGDMQEAVKFMQEEQDMVLLSLMAFTAVIVAPICEEIFFRGFMHAVAKKFFGLPLGGIAIALIFAAAHGNAVSLLPLFIFALLLTALYEVTGSIWAPISAHMLFNATTVAAQFAARSGLVEMPSV